VLRRFYADNGGGLGKPGKSVICATCSFEPWATQGRVARVTIYVVNRHGRILRTVRARQSGASPRIWVAHLWLLPGQFAAVPKGAVRDSYGETNSRTVVY
jgi:hypothetical protein